MNKVFPVLLFAVSVLIAGTAAFFSVRGIGLLFVGSFLPVVVMASSLEIGKLFAVSFLYRKWYVMPKMLRLYLSVATLLLIVITSLGIFGFLSDAYQGTKNKIDYIDTKIENIQTKNDSIRSQIESRQTAQKQQSTNSNTNVDRYKQIYDDFVSQQNKNKQTLIDRRQQLDDQVTELEKKSGGLFSNAKKKLEQMKNDQAAERGEIQSKLTTINKAIDDEYQSFLAKVDRANTTETDVFDVSELLLQIEVNNDQILELQNQVSETDIGSFRFIAQAFGIEVDTAVKWFIIMIVVVFDPLAMCLIIGYNVYVHGSARVQPKNLIPTTMNSKAGGVRITAIKK